MQRGNHRMVSLIRPADSLFQEGVKHGISCLSQDSYGAYIAASCMDNR
jgi:denticleless